MHPEEPGPPRPEAGRDVRRESGHVLGAVGVRVRDGRRVLPGLREALESLVEAELAADGTVGDHRVGRVAGGLERLGEHREVAGDGDPDLAHDAVVLGVGRGEHRRERRPGLRPLRLGELEADALGREPVEVGRGRARVAPGREVVGAQRVDGEQQQIGRPRGRGRAAGRGRALPPHATAASARSASTASRQPGQGAPVQWAL